MSIDLFWFRHRSGQGNFGDELSPWIVRQLAPRSAVRWVDPLLGEKPLTSRLGRWAKSQIRPRPAGYDIRYSRWHALLRRPSLLAVGSIINRAHRANTSVWGSGIISKDDQIADGKFLAVRGPKTHARLSELGLETPGAMGDPALLVPLLYRPDSTKDSDVTLIPHYQHYGALAGAAQKGVRVLNLTAPIGSLLEGIASSRVTLSTSLHGVIVSHAFGVPSLWVSTDEVQGTSLGGDGVKFEDYFASVGLSQATAVDIGSLAEMSPRNLRAVVEDAFGATLPSRSVVAERQRDLLMTAPFPAEYLPA